MTRPGGGVSYCAQTSLRHGVSTGRSTIHSHAGHLRSSSDSLEAGGKNRDRLSGRDIFQLGGACWWIVQISCW